MDSYPLHRIAPSSADRWRSWERKDVEAKCDDGQLNKDLEDANKAAQDLLAVTSALKAAQLQLRSQATSVELVTTAACGDSTALAHPQLQAALAQVQDTVGVLAQSQALVDEASARVAAAMEGFKAGHHQALQAVSLLPAAIHRCRNATGSTFLSLPDTALQRIAQDTGTTIRLVCQQLRDAYAGHNMALYLDSDMYPPEEAPPPHVALPAWIPAWQWHGHVARLDYASTEFITVALLADIACHLPQLQQLTCPWPEPHQPAAWAAPPAPLTALTSISLESPCSQHHDIHPQHPVHAAMAVLPLLAPRLASLRLHLHRMLQVDAAPVPLLGSISSSLTHLCLTGYGSKEEVDRSHAAVLHTLVAYSSVRSLELLNINLSRHEDLKAAVHAMRQLATLRLAFRFSDMAVVDFAVPACSQLHQLERLDLQDGDIIPEWALAHWLPAGASSRVRELVLPEFACHSRSVRPMVVPPLKGILAAIKSHTNLTHLTIGMRDEARQDGEDAPLRWAVQLAAASQLRSLSLSYVDMEELALAAPHWSALTCLTRLDATIGVWADGCGSVVQGAWQAISLLISLQWVGIEFCGLVERGGEDGVGTWLARRRCLLDGVAGLPQLQVLDLSGRVYPTRQLPLTVDDVRALAAGRAATRLRRLVLLRNCVEEAAAQELDVLLPGVRIERA